MDDLIREFIVESSEALDKLDSDLVTLEEAPQDPELLAGIFRAMHTIKGSCGFLGLDILQSVTHHAENLLVLMREGKLILNAEITTALLTTADVVREILTKLESTGKEGTKHFEWLTDELARLQKTAGVQPALPPSTQSSPPPPADSPALSPAPQQPTPHSEAEPVAVENTHPAPPSEPDPVAVPEVAVADEPTAIAEAAPAPTAAEGTDGEVPTPRSSIADSTIRVDVELLDKLMNLVGELVLSRNQILQHTSALGDRSVIAATQRLNLVTTELQGGVMKTRMQAVKTVWSKFPRVVRDLARACGKRVRVEMDGEGTELDKTILEAIKDPLTHMVRNSVDHGIEAPEARRQLGKPEEGVLGLRAFHEGGQVILEINDDGAGLSAQKVRDKAIQKGLLTAEQAARISDREAMNMIFQPGFSTAEKVTNVSGRGVGMDVVRTNIEKIGGSVDVLSTLGQGTTMRVKIPLTLAIIPALIVTCEGQQYAIPQVSLLELVLLEGEGIEKGIETIHGAPVYRLRGNILPLLYLSRELGLTQERRPMHDRRIINIVVLQADETQFGLVVDVINDTEEIVVKPLSRHLKNIPAFSGATVRGDGGVCLILDVLGIAQAGNLLHTGADRSDRVPAEEATQGERLTLLTFRDGTRELMALPIDSVARLEEICRTRVEWLGDQRVVQYRGEIMPLIRVREFFDRNAPDLEEGDQMLQVIVHTQHGSSVGIVVDNITDIVTEDVKIQREIRRPGLRRSMVVQGKVTQEIDLEAIVHKLVPGSFLEEAKCPA